MSDWAKAVPISDQRALTVARVVNREWIPRYNVQQQIHWSVSSLSRRLSTSFASLSVWTKAERRHTVRKLMANATSYTEHPSLCFVALSINVLMTGFLFSPVFQAYRSTIMESTGFTPHRLVFGREMRLPVDFGSPLPKPPRDVRTFANDLAEDLEWLYRVPREVICYNHKRAEIRFNQRVVEKQFAPGYLVRVVKYSTPSRVS